MKVLFFVIVLLASVTCKSQSIFDPIPPPSQNPIKLSATAPIVRTDVRFITTVSATISDGTQLNGGFGIAVERNAWNDLSQAYITKYFVAGVGFLGTDGTRITGTAGAVFGVPGTNGIVGTGLGYDFTYQKLVFITGVFIKL